MKPSQPQPPTLLPRLAAEAIPNITKTFKVLLIAGPRQVGKTTLLKSLMPENMSYVTLDDTHIREQAETDPRLFLEEHPAPLLIDEVQYAPSLFSYLKIAVDQSDLNGQYWLTGSQQFHLMKNISDSLAGRVGIVNLNSLTYAEINRLADKRPFNPAKLEKPTHNITSNQLFETIFRGGMPRLYSEPDLSRDFYLQSYIDTYISRDIRDLKEVGNSEAFKTFLVSVATRTGEQLNYTSLANDAGISVPTAKSWLSILVATGLVYLHRPYLSSRLQRLTHMPKIIFMDTGLASFLAGWEDARTLQLSSSAGRFLETFVISEIVKAYNARGLSPNISYYRDKDKHEIDLIFFKNGQLYPFEIKKTATPRKEMLSNFSYLRAKGNKVAPGGLICLYDGLSHLDDTNFVIPIESVIG